jgi:hypothetical protein
MMDFFNEKIEAANVEIPTVEILLSLIDGANHTWNSATKVSIIQPTKFTIEEETCIFEFLNSVCWHFLVIHGIVQQLDDEWR